MTTESTQPQTELGPAPANGQGQSQGHRRRRRRRKNKSSQASAPQAQQAQPVNGQPVEMKAPAAPPRESSQPQPGSQRPAKVQQGQGRKKKKFFQKTSAPPPQPGNSVGYSSQGNGQGNGQASGQGKRKTKQRGPREFVGPMDHSYRAVNGNISDGPASTIQITSNGHNSHYQDLYVAQPTVAIKPDTPTRIFCFIEDLFFLAKIQETARKLGVKVEFIKGGDKESVAKLTDVPEADKPTLLVFDLNNLNAKPISLIPKFKAKLKKATSIIGFLNHLQGDLKMKAIEAGCDTVMPRSAFSQSLPNLLRRYGLEEEDEYAQQPM
jgi:hypothetical protein